ncbi:MAG: hypothetical protein INF50_09500 [Rhodobacter sp.]|nr:hypothetical protein [Rhodobacter sp.]
MAETGTVSALAGGAATLGGGAGIRLIVDDAVATTKMEALRMITVLRQRLTEENWPPT